jgi:hypothetical protein
MRGSVFQDSKRYQGRRLHFTRYPGTDGLLLLVLGAGPSTHQAMDMLRFVIVFLHVARNRYFI